MTAPQDEEPRADDGDRDRQGARDEFVAELARNHARLLAYVYSLLPNQADAEDVLQRTSLILWRKLDEWDRSQGFLPWACGVAFYEVRNFTRVAGRDRLQFGTDLLTQLADERVATFERRDERLEALKRCLQKLEARDAELVARAYEEEGRTIKALAAESGRAVQTLYNHLNQIRRRLFSCVEMRLAARGGEP